jgi:DNA-binding GntR family transcriptional regulator
VVRTDTVYKKAFNDALQLTAGLKKGDPIPSENSLALSLGVSRTTVRKVLAALREQGIIEGSGRDRLARATGHGATPYPDAETVTASAHVERSFMEWMVQGNALPGTTINELELARKFGVATTVIREFLNGFKRFGLIEKRPNSGWVLQGFTSGFALELFEIREMFELRSAQAFAALPPDSPLWQSLTALRAEHVALLEEIDARYTDFSGLDSRFHKLINLAAPNRFIDSFYDTITLVFHYHYQWNKDTERDRNEAAAREHIAYIDALLSRNVSAVDRACRAHLASAKLTLLRSTSDPEFSSARPSSAQAVGGTKRIDSRGRKVR